MKKYSVAKFKQKSHDGKLFGSIVLLNETDFFKTKEDAERHIVNMKLRNPQYLWALSEYDIERDPDIEEIITHRYVI
jgi:hypothetical protein